nr:CDP-glycerol glycerophosphotransferase family protein [Angustibacter aerolatus]
MTHVWLNHGDSEKPACFNPVHAIYDRIFTAGQAGIDRYGRHGVDIDPAKFEVVGRPQVEAIDVVRTPVPAEPTVLYAPTWVGPFADTNVYSLPVGRGIVQALLDRGCTVIFRAHPLNYGYPVARRLIREIGALLDADRAATGRQHLWGRAAEQDLTLEECFNRSDAMVADVSAVVSDYLYSEKPFSIVAVDATSDQAGRRGAGRGGGVRALRRPARRRRGARRPARRRPAARAAPGHQDVLPGGLPGRPLRRGLPRRRAPRRRHPAVRRPPGGRPCPRGVTPGASGCAARSAAPRPPSRRPPRPGSPWSRSSCRLAGGPQALVVACWVLSLLWWVVDAVVPHPASERTRVDAAVVVATRLGGRALLVLTTALGAGPTTSVRWGLGLLLLVAVVEPVLTRLRPPADAEHLPGLGAQRSQRPLGVVGPAGVVVTALTGLLAVTGADGAAWVGLGVLHAAVALVAGAAGLRDLLGRRARSAALRAALERHAPEPARLHRPRRRRRPPGRHVAAGARAHRPPVRGGHPRPRGAGRGRRGDDGAGGVARGVARPGRRGGAVGPRGALRERRLDEHQLRRLPPPGARLPRARRVRQGAVVPPVARHVRPRAGRRAGGDRAVRPARHRHLARPVRRGRPAPARRHRASRPAPGRRPARGALRPDLGRVQRRQARTRRCRWPRRSCAACSRSRCGCSSGRTRSAAGAAPSAAGWPRSSRLLAQDAARTGRDHRWGAQVEQGTEFADSANASDVLVADLSSVLVDYLVSGKPMAVVAAGAGARYATDFAARHPVARAAAVVRPDGTDAGQVLAGLLGADEPGARAGAGAAVLPGRPHRRAVPRRLHRRHHLLRRGSPTSGASTSRTWPTSPTWASPADRAAVAAPCRHAARRPTRCAGRGPRASVECAG